MIHITKQLDGERLRKWRDEGFVDETVLVVPLHGMLYELGVRAMETPSHTAPTDPARAATLDEVAELAVLLAERAEVRGDRTELTDLKDLSKERKP